MTTRASRYARTSFLPVLLALLGGAVAAWALSRVVDQAVTDRTEASLLSALERLAPDVEKDLATGTDPTGTILRAGRTWGVRATLITADGRVLVDSGVDPVHLGHVENHAGRPEVREALRSGTGTDRRLSATVARRFLYLARRLAGDNVLRFAVAEDDVLEAEAPFRRKVSLVSLGAALLAGLLVALVRGRHADELVLLREAAEAVERGERPASPGAISDETAAVLAVLGHFADEVRTESESRRRQEAVKQTVFDSLPAGILVVDRDLRVLDTNPAALALLGRPKGSPPPSGHLLEVVRDSVLLGVLEKAVAGERSAWVPIRPDGAPRPLEVRAWPLPGGSGRPGDPSALAVLQEAAPQA